MPTQVTQAAFGYAGESPFVAINIGSLLTTGGLPSIGLTELTIQNGSAVSGNLVLTTFADISSESEGFPISDTYTIRAAGNSASDRIQATELYVFSETALKDFSIYARSLP